MKYTFLNNFEKIKLKFKNLKKKKISIIKSKKYRDMDTHTKWASISH